MWFHCHVYFNVSTMLDQPPAQSNPLKAATDYHRQRPPLVILPQTLQYIYIYIYVCMYICICIFTHIESVCYLRGIGLGRKLLKHFIPQPDLESGSSGVARVATSLTQTGITSVDEALACDAENGTTCRKACGYIVPKLRVPLRYP